MSNEPFSLSQWEDFGRHMTVFHYRTDMQTKHCLEFDDFVRVFDEEYGSGAYAKVRQAMEVMAAEVVEAACFFGDDDNEAKEGKGTDGVVGDGKGKSTSGKKKEGMGHLARARALLGLDVMLEWVGDDDEETGKVMVPRLLEVTYAPDLRRVLREHPAFVNEVFQTLILDEPPAEAVTRIL
jgi:hypothetical protein